MVSLDLTRVDDAALMELRDDIDALRRPWRELAVLAGCCDAPMATLARLPLGARDRLLLEVRAHLFGGRVDAESRCDRCGEHLDLSFDARALLGASADHEGPRYMDLGSTRLRLRAPDSSDVAAASEGSDAETTMLLRCIEGVDDAAELLRDPAVREAIGRQLAALDPDAETRLTGTCPACGAACETVFDAAGFLLAEIAVYTDRLVDEVDQLARAYGWREADILALGARRRRRYLELTS